MAIIRWNPYRELRNFERVFNRFFDTDYDAIANRGEDSNRLLDWVPASDIKESKDGYRISLELPGVEKENVKVNLNDDVLTIQGEKKAEKKTDEEDYHAVERVYGSFSRSFRLPGLVDSNKVKAEFKNGVLHLELPKAEGAKPKQIEIN